MGALAQGASALSRPFNVFKGDIMSYEIEVSISDRSLYVSNDGVFDVPIEAAPIRLDLCVDGGLAGLSVSDVSLSDYVTQEQLSSSLSAVSPVISPVSFVRWVGNGQASRSFALPCVPGVIRFFLTSGAERFFIAGVGVYIMDSDSRNWHIDDGVYGKLSLVNNLLTLHAGTSFNAYNDLGRVVVAVIYPLDIIEVLL